MRGEIQTYCEVKRNIKRQSMVEEVKRSAYTNWYVTVVAYSLWVGYTVASELNFG